MLGAGVILTRATRFTISCAEQVYRSSGEIPLIIPENAAAVPGAEGKAAEWGLSDALTGWVIVKDRDEKTQGSIELGGPAAMKTEFPNQGRFLLSGAGLDRLRLMGDYALQRRHNRSLSIGWSSLGSGVLRLRIRRSLTPGTAGGCLGWRHDPHFCVATDLQVLSSIFLKLIKTIISPLIFSTLVVGIAGHSNLKQVGRMGIKALLYFEIVTTIALFIGLGAIHLTRAGEGLTAPPNAAAATVSATPQKWTDVVLQFFRRISPGRFLKAR